MGGRFIGKASDNAEETEKVTPREAESLSTLSQAANIHQSVRLSNPQQTLAGTNIMPQDNLQNTMIQIQNNLTSYTSSSSRLVNQSNQIGISYGDGKAVI